MRNSKLLLIIPLLLAACTTDPVQEQLGETSAAGEVSVKIANTSENAVEGTLIVCFDEEAVPTLERAAAEAKRTRSGAVTRSGLARVDEILESVHVVSFERVFPETERFEARTRAAGLHRWYVLEFDPEQDLDEAAVRLAEVAEVAEVQFSARLRKCFDGEAVPLGDGAALQSRAMVTADFNDPQLPWQWHYINNADQAIATTSRAGADIRVADAWRLTAGDPRVIVAIVDEGVKYTHPDLAANMWVNPDPDPEMKDLHGYNFIDDGPITWNRKGDSGHATHIAGTIAAVNNNSLGVCGVAGGTGHNDGVRIMSCQIFSGDGVPTDYQSSRAVKYAADHGASILQCSYGYDAGKLRSDNAYERESPLLVAALRYFMEQDNCPALDGGLVFFSAGNESTAMAGYPSAYRDYISVTSFSADYLPAYYTNYGSGCNIAAPGGELSGLSGGKRAGILSTLCSEISEDDYGYMQGTSMACPHASGAAALGLSYALAKGKRFTREEFSAMVLTSVNDIDQYLAEGTKVSGSTIDLENYYRKMGTGSVDAYRLLMQVEGTPCVTVPLNRMQLIALTEHFGGGAENLTYTGVEMDGEDMDRLGLIDAPRIFNGKLQIKCTRPGSARIRVTAVAGGTRPATGVLMGGTEITKEFAILARPAVAENGGWL